MPRPHLSYDEAISIHALREEGDGLVADIGDVLSHFYPRPPRGGRPEIVFSTASIIWISIHALREEGDHFGLPEHHD